MTLRETLSAEFDPRTEVLHFTGRGNQTFDYIEDETVMDRLDDALGVGNWSIHVEPISVADGIVKVTLSGRTPDGAEFTYEDFGYQTRDGGESLKEAVSDGIRRCGRYLGVARYLYKKHTSAGSSSPARSTGRAAPSSARPAAPPARSSTNVPEPPEFPDDFGEPTPIRRPANGGGRGWTFKELAAAAEDRGIAKNAIYAQADKLFGKGTKVTDLSPDQREQIAFEMGLVG